MTPLVNGKTVQQRAWLALREIGPANASLIGARIGMSRESARHAMNHLIVRGFVRKDDGRVRNVVYAAIGTRQPKSLIGKSPGSRNRAHNLGPKLLAANRARLGDPTWLPKPRVDATPLAQAWRGL